MLIQMPSVGRSHLTKASRSTSTQNKKFVLPVFVLMLVLCVSFLPYSCAHGLCCRNPIANYCYASTCSL